MTVSRETPPPQWSAPDDAGDQLDAGELGGELLAGAAELAPAMFAPVPVVTVDGVDVASGAASAASSLMVVDGLRVTWGRDEVLAQPTPATGRLVLFDTTRTWATAQDRRGRPVTIRYEGLAPDGSTVSSVFFRGRIGSPVKVARKDAHRRVDGKLVRGALVTLPLQSAVVDLANITPRTSYPAETLGARLDRVVAAAQAAGHLAGGGRVRAYWRDPEVAPVAAKDQVSLLAHLSDLFDSAGADNYTYRPATDDVQFLPRRNWGHRSMGRLWWDTAAGTARQGEGAYIKATDVILSWVEAEDGPGLYLDSAATAYDLADGVTTPPRITRVALTHPDAGAAYASRSVELSVRREPYDPAGGHAVLDEKALGVRTARVDSIVAWNAWADLSLADTEYLVRREASRWVLEPLRLSTRRLGGFESVYQAQVLLAGYETNATVFLQRSFLPELGIRPAFGVMGATMAYARGGWDLELTPAPLTTYNVQHSLTAEDLAAEPLTYQVQAWDAPHPKGWHSSVTAEDLRYVGLGLSGVWPATNDKDEYQT